MPEADAPPPAAPRPDPPPRRASFIDRRWFTAGRLQILANVLTVVVAVAAIALSVWEGYENRRHNRLSVLPQLENRTSTHREAPDTLYTLRYALANTGLGPAFLTNILIFREGELIFDGAESRSYTDLNGIRSELDALPFPAMGIWVHQRRAGEMLEAGEMHLLFRLLVPPADSLGRSGPDVVREVMSRYSFVFCYCSVYREDCGVATLSARPPPGEYCHL